MDKNAIIELAAKLTRGVQNFSFDDKTYSADEATNVLRCALIEANGGKETISYKDMRRNKTELFEIMEEIIARVTADGLAGNEFWMNYVDERNLARGDRNSFTIPSNSLFVVSEVADGIATPRRQRIGKASTVTIPTSVHAVRIYEEFALFMAGRIDWTELCNRVARSFQQEIWNDVFAAFSAVTTTTTGLNTKYVLTGDYSEDTLIELVSRVEAATGRAAVILGTKAALKKLTASVIADSARESMHTLGYYGSFFGTPEIMMPQRLKSGTEEFLLDDTTVYVVAGDERFIHLVNEGDATIIEKDATSNADMSIEYTTLMRWGVAVWFSDRCFGKYTLSGTAPTPGN